MCLRHMAQLPHWGSNMGFIIFHPLKKQLIDVTTTNAPEKQLWQELVALRHLSKPKGISGKKATAPWIDQAKIYFIDAYKADWRSSGLLYYYSFLNLAKAYLAAKRSTSAKDLKSVSSYHGLSAEPQSPRRLIDFEIRIYPPVFRGKQNVFAKFYETFTCTKWPHSQDITIKISDIIPYCRELTTEVRNFYGIDSDIIYVYSLIRYVDQTFWFELNVPSDKQAIIVSHINNIPLSSLDARSINAADKTDWLSSYGLTMQNLIGTTFLRTPAVLNDAAKHKQTIEGLLDAFGDYSLPLPMPSVAHNVWQFIPKLSLGSQKVVWHPLLSDYLVAFALSSILRYQPHLFKPNSQDAYLAEAWCAQSAITALRYYLMALTIPSIRCN